MDGARFDKLSRSLAALASRRGVVRALAGVPLAAASGLLGEDAAARSRQAKKRQRKHDRDQVQDETFHHRKTTFCLNGKTFKALRRKKLSLLAQGATVGRCTDQCQAATCESLGKTCATWSDGCGVTLQCGTCGDGLVGCENGVCTTCDDACGGGCDCVNLTDGSTRCTSSSPETSCQACATSADCPASQPYCASTYVLGDAVDNLPEGCSLPPSVAGVCTTIQPCVI